MKKLLLFFIAIFLQFASLLAQNSVGIGTENPSTNAVLQLVSPTNNQGFLVPRLTTAQRTADTFTSRLTTADNGLMVFDTNLSTFFYWVANRWELVSGTLLTGGTGVTIDENGVISIEPDVPQDLVLANNQLRITNNTTATVIDLTPYLNIQTAAQVVVTPTTTLTSATVQAALEELQAEILNPAGNMLKATYDPTNINGSAFDLATHTGNLPSTRITGLGTAAVLNVGIGANNIVQLDGIGLPAVDGSRLTGLSLAQFPTLGDLATLDVVGSTEITDNSIFNTDINIAAQIAGTKITPNFGTQNVTTSGSITGGTFIGDGGGLTGVSVPDGTITGGTGTGAKIAATTITNDNISATAAIEGTKIAPDFGTQNIITTGTITSSTSKLILTNPSSTDTAFTAKTYSNQAGGYAISGIHEGTGDVAGFFLINNPSSTFPALYGETRGTSGVGVMGTVGVSATGHGGFFSNFNASNTSPVVKINTAGTAPALRIEGGMELVNGSEGLGKILVSDATGLATWQSATGTSWGVTGNAGMVDGTNFIGTTDGAPLNFVVNNQDVGQLDDSGNVFFGLDAGINNTATDNTFIGSNSGQTNTSGNLNAFYGSGSGANNTIGSNNSFIGFWTGLNNSTGNDNTFVGYSAGRSNATANNNSFFGSQVGLSNTTGAQNSFFGYGAGSSNSTASGNSFFGFVSGYFNTTGLGNSSFGFSAGSDNTTGNYNTTMGYQAANLNTVGTENTMVGAFAGQNNTANGNSFYGYNSGRNNTTGDANSFSGFRSGENNTIGAANSFFGYNAGLSNITGSSNSFFGFNSGLSNTTGFGNTYFGDHSGTNNATGIVNSFFGYQAGQSNSGNYNSFFGESAGNANTTGSDNTFFGNGTGGTNTTGSQITLIGRSAIVSVDGLTNATAIGANSVVGASNSLVLGGTGANAVNVGIGTTTPGHKLEVFGAGNAFSHTDGNVVVESQIAGNDAWFGTASANHNFHILSGGFDVAVFKNNGTLGISRFPLAHTIEVEGDASKTTAGSWVANSDRRIKTDIKDIDNSFQLIKSLRPVKFKYTDEWMAAHPSIKDQYYYNFIAQEYQKVFPESIHLSGEYLEGDTAEIIQIDTYNAQIASIKAVQELIYKIEALEKENEALKSTNRALESKLTTVESNQSAILKDLASLKALLTGDQNAVKKSSTDKSAISTSLEKQ